MRKVRKLFGENPVKVVVKSTEVDFDQNGDAEVSEEIADVLATIPGYAVVGDAPEAPELPPEDDNGNGEQEPPEDENVDQEPENDDSEGTNEEPAEEPAEEEVKKPSPRKQAPRKPAPKKS